jgi:two-component system response regulator
MFTNNDTTNLQSRPAEILLVEDNSADIRLTREALKSGRVLQSLNVVTDGMQAMAYLRKEGEFARAATPDLVLLDLNLPKKDGREVLAEIKADPALKLIPVVILTTSSEEEDVVKAYGLRANCYITKPVDYQQFVKIVQNVETFWFTVVTLP